MSRRILSTGRMPASAPSSPPASMAGTGTHKAYITISLDMKETQLYLERAAYAEAYRRQIKEDDVQDIMAHKSNVMGTWKTRKLMDPNTFFVAGPSRKAVHHLMTLGRLKGNGFQVQISHWDQFKGGLPHNLKHKISASLLNLPLICWNSQSMATMVASFGLPHRVSKSCLH